MPSKSLSVPKATEIAQKGKLLNNNDRNFLLDLFAACGLEKTKCPRRPPSFHINQFKGGESVITETERQKQEKVANSLQSAFIYSDMWDRAMTGDPIPFDNEHSVFLNFKFFDNLCIDPLQHLPLEPLPRSFTIPTIEFSRNPNAEQYIGIYLQMILTSIQAHPEIPRPYNFGIRISVAKHEIPIDFSFDSNGVVYISAINTLQGLNPHMDTYANILRYKIVPVIEEAVNAYGMKCNTDNLIGPNIEIIDGPCELVAILCNAYRVHVTNAEFKKNHNISHSDMMKKINYTDMIKDLGIPQAGINGAKVENEKEFWLWLTALVKDRAVDPNIVRPEDLYTFIKMKREEELRNRKSNAQLPVLPRQTPRHAMAVTAPSQQQPPPRPIPHTDPVTYTVTGSDNNKIISITGEPKAVEMITSKISLYNNYKYRKANEKINMMPFRHDKDKFTIELNNLNKKKVTIISGILTEAKAVDKTPTPARRSSFQGAAQLAARATTAISKGLSRTVKATTPSSATKSCVSILQMGDDSYEITIDREKSGLSETQWRDFIAQPGLAIKLGLENDDNFCIRHNSDEGIVITGNKKNVDIAIEPARDMSSIYSAITDLIDKARTTPHQEGLTHRRHNP